MSLEFRQVEDQIEALVRLKGKLDFDEDERLQLALERFENAPDLEVIHERIEQVRQPDISGYRGAAPLDPPYDEPINQMFDPPKAPATATILSADGSQIYPDERHHTHYYLLNIGLFVYHHGIDRLPEPTTIPKLFFRPEDVHNGSGWVISNRTVDARRTVTEMAALADMAWGLRGEARPLAALYDNRLLYWAGVEVSDSREIMKRYHGALQRLHDSQTLLAGYIDKPGTRQIIRLLYLLSLHDDEIKHKQDELQRGGDLVGLNDALLFRHVLQAGQRSALMVANSPENQRYKERDPGHEIAFFYIDVSNGYRRAIARVDVPLWVARDKAAVGELHALILAQCNLQGRNPYPYALTRADELAHVGGDEKRKLNEMINVQLRLSGLAPAAFSGKDWGKELARGGQRRHRL